MSGCCHIGPPLGRSAWMAVLAAFPPFWRTLGPNLFGLLGGWRFFFVFFWAGGGREYWRDSRPRHPDPPQPGLAHHHIPTITSPRCRGIQDVVILSLLKDCNSIWPDWWSRRVCMGGGGMAVLKQDMSFGPMHYCQSGWDAIKNGQCRAA